MDRVGMGMVTDHTNEPLTPMVFIGGRPQESARATQELIEGYTENELALLEAGFIPAGDSTEHSIGKR